MFKGIHCDLDEEQVLENGIFWRIRFLSKSSILRVKGIFLSSLQPPVLRRESIPVVVFFLKYILPVSILRTYYRTVVLF